MAYSTDILTERVTILNRGTGSTGDFGKKAGDYEEKATYWCDWKWTRGAKAMQEGALDAYDTVLVRLRYCEAEKGLTKEENATRISYDSRLRKDGYDYQVESLHSDKRANETQVTARRIVK